jgi:hypothetical protein
MWKPGQCGNPNKLGVLGKKPKPIAWKVNKKGCWEVTSHAPDSYGYPRITRNRRTIKIAVWIWENEYGRKFPKGMYCCHHCDNPLCVRWGDNHCYVGTPKENNHEMTAHGRDRYIKGEDHYKARLTWQKIREIRELFNLGFTNNKIAEIFNVGRGTIWAVRKEITWQNKA